MKIQIRPYTEKDYNYTHDVHRKNMMTYVDKYWGGWNSDVYRRGVCPDMTWIIEYKSQKVGFFVLSFESKAHLRNIQISSDYQNMGLGSKTLEHCECESINKGYDSLYLQVFLDNPARQLYERRGYVTYKVTESHFMMKKDLTSRAEQTQAPNACRASDASLSDRHKLPGNNSCESAYLRRKNRRLRFVAFPYEAFFFLG